MRRLALNLCVLASLALPAAPAGAATAVDWSEYLAARVELSVGWYLEGCLRMDPSLCAYDADGDLAGTVILAVYDTWKHEDVSRQGMVDHVADFHEVFREDRLATCGDGFAYEAAPLVDVPFAGEPGYRFGFTLTDAAGVINEHVVIHTTFASGIRFVLNTNFVDPDGCPGEDHERDEFTPAHMPSILPHLDALAAGSILPVDFRFGPACARGTVPGAGFTDTAGSVHAPSVDCLARHRIVEGVSADRYDPAAVMTRGQAASLLARLLEAFGEELPEPADQGFTDIAASVHAERINQLAAIGLLHGTTATTFEPLRPVSRAQAAALAARVHEFALGRDLYDAGIAFPDGEGVHAPLISRAATAGLVHGTADGRFAPGEPVRRDQFATIAARTLNRVSWSRWVSLPGDGAGGDGPGQPQG